MKLSNTAADKIKEIIKQNSDGQKLMLRVDIEGYG